MSFCCMPHTYGLWGNIFMITHSKLYASTAAASLLILCNTAQASDVSHSSDINGQNAARSETLSLSMNAGLTPETLMTDRDDQATYGNVAELLERLPGVQIDRANGIGTAVRVRGLSTGPLLWDGDIFITGRDMYQTGEGSGNGNTNTYHNSLETLFPGLFRAIDIDKTPDAMIAAESSGSAINLHSLRAIDGPQGVAFTAQAGSGYAQNAEHTSPSVLLRGSYRLADTLGIDAALAWDSTSIRTYEMQAENRQNWAIAGPNAGFVNTIGRNYIEPEMMYLTNRTIGRTRGGAYIGVEYHPTQALSLSLKWLHSDMRTQTSDTSDKLNFSPLSDGYGIVSTEPYSVSDNGVVQQGTFASRVLELSTLANVDRNIADNAQFSASYDGSRFHATAKISYGRGEAYSQFAQQDVTLSAYSVDINATNNYNDTIVNNYPNYNGCGGNSSVHNAPCTFTYSNIHGLYPVVQYTNPLSLNDPDDGLFKAAWAWALGNRNTQTAARLDGEYDATENIYLRFGARYGVHTVSYDYGRYLLWNTIATPSSADYDHWTYYQDPGLSGVPIVTFANAPGRLKNIRNFFPQAGLNSVLVQDPGQMIHCPACWLDTQANLNQYQMQFFQDPTNSFHVDNRVWSGYVMTEISTPSDALRINAGVRVEHTKRTVMRGSYTKSGAAFGNASWNGVPVSGGTITTRRDYTEILPSLNATYQLTEDSNLRFAASRNMAEQDDWKLGMGNMYYYTFRVSGTGPSAKTAYLFDNGSAGNPDLKPAHITQLDLAYEYAWNHNGLIHLGLFFKDISSIVDSVNKQIKVSDDVGGTTGIVSTYVNGKGATSHGAEILAQYGFENGAGFNINYTYNDSRTSVSSAFKNHLPLAGLSRHAINAQISYDKGPLAATLLYGWRSRALDETFNIMTASDASRQTWAVYNRAYGHIDASVRYRLFENISLILSGRNLGGSAQSRYLQYSDQPFSYDQSGRRYDLVIKFRN